MAGFVEPLEITLPQDLKNGDGHGVGEVETAQRRTHGDAQGRIFVPEQQIFRQSGCLLAEH